MSSKTSAQGNTSSFASSLKSTLAALVIPIAIAVSIVIFIKVLGDPKNFQGGDNANLPLPGNYLGTVYKGGVIVPILISLFLIVFTFAIERFITISRAKGRGRIESFIAKIRGFITGNDIDSALAACDVQKGSVANVIRAGLTKYQQMEKETGYDKEKKGLAIQKELEEATSLELPMLSKNLVIISTIASVATSLGLLGTVLGMIKAFSALAQAGAPDAVALSTGISEALINTALGIGTSALSIILYNFFTSKIDSLTYGIDEAGYSIVEGFATNYKE